LYAEASLLYKTEKLARASALAVIAVEEFAKSIIYLVAALMPDQRGLLPPKLDGHAMKHSVAGAAEAAEIMNEEYWAVLNQEGTSSTWEYGRLADMVKLSHFNLTLRLTSSRSTRHDAAEQGDLLHDRDRATRRRARAAPRGRGRRGARRSGRPGRRCKKSDEGNQ